MINLNEDNIRKIVCAFCEIGGYTEDNSCLEHINSKTCGICKDAINMAYEMSRKNETIYTLNERQLKEICCLSCTEGLINETQCIRFGNKYMQNCPFLKRAIKFAKNIQYSNFHSSGKEDKL